MSIYLILLPPLMLLLGVGLVFYLWRTIEAPRGDSDRAVGEEAAGEEPNEDEAEEK